MRNGEFTYLIHFPLFAGFCSGSILLNVDVRACKRYGMLLCALIPFSVLACAVPVSLLVIEFQDIHLKFTHCILVVLVLSVGLEFEAGWEFS
jgi:membrane-bound metal-dependent hydrolase YbcI (DUF457 family)